MKYQTLQKNEKTTEKIIQEETEVETAEEHKAKTETTEDHETEEAVKIVIAKEILKVEEVEERDKHSIILQTKKIDLIGLFFFHYFRFPS